MPRLSLHGHTFCRIRVQQRVLSRALGISQGSAGMRQVTTFGRKTPELVRLAALVEHRHSSADFGFAVVLPRRRQFVLRLGS